MVGRRMRLCLRGLCGGRRTDVLERSHLSYCMLHTPMRGHIIVCLSLVGETAQKHNTYHHTIESTRLHALYQWDPYHPKSSKLACPLPLAWRSFGWSNPWSFAAFSYTKLCPGVSRPLSGTAPPCIIWLMPCVKRWANIIPSMSISFGGSTP